MALEWRWSEKVGEAVIRQGEKEYTLNLYKGNAFLIMIYEYKGEDGTDKYSMYSFFADKEHAKRSLGLDKKNGYKENHYKDELVMVRIDKSKYIYAKELVDMLVRSFDEIRIEIYSSDKIEQNVDQNVDKRDSR